MKWCKGGFHGGWSRARGVRTIVVVHWCLSFINWRLEVTAAAALFGRLVKLLQLELVIIYKPFSMKCIFYFRLHKSHFFFSLVSVRIWSNLVLGEALITEQLTHAVSWIRNVFWVPGEQKKKSSSHWSQRDLSISLSHSEKNKRNFYQMEVRTHLLKLGPPPSGHISFVKHPEICA